MGHFDIKLIFRTRRGCRSLLRPLHGLAWYCSTSRIGPPPFGGSLKRKKKKNHNNKGLLIVVIVLICQRPLFLFLNTSTWFLYIVSEMSGPVVCTITFVHLSFRVSVTCSKRVLLMLVFCLLVCLLLLFFFLFFCCFFFPCHAYCLGLRISE